MPSTTTTSAPACMTGEITQPYQCRGEGCMGVTLGPVRIDNSLGVDIELRDVSFDNAVLRAVQPDGSLSDTDTVTVRAALVGAFFDDPGVVPLPPVTCAPSTLDVRRWCG